MTPDEFLTMTGTTATFAYVGPSKMTQGCEYRVTLFVGDASETFTYHSSGFDESRGKAPEAGSVVGCLASDFSYARDHDDREALADELASEFGGEHPPTHWLKMADAMLGDAAKLRRLYADHLDDLVEVEW